LKSPDNDRLQKRFSALGKPTMKHLLLKTFGSIAKLQWEWVCVYWK